MYWQHNKILLAMQKFAEKYEEMKNGGEGKGEGNRDPGYLILLAGWKCAVTVSQEQTTRYWSVWFYSAY
jgi:hypothetical protein